GLFFFFQAEDGIRVFHVTGVQTCALPICIGSVPGACMAAPVRCSTPPLGFVHAGPDNAPMEIKSDNPEHGFQFPGTFELSAMGAADKGLETELPKLLEAAGVQVLEESIQWKHSSNGKYVSVRIGFRAESRE